MSVLQLLWSHLLVIVMFGAVTVIFARVLVQRRPTGSMFAWLLAIVLIPYVGVPLYLVFGGRKVKRRAAKKQKLYAAAPPGEAIGGDIARMLSASGAPLPSRGNAVELLSTGEIAYAAVIDAIERATKSIHVSTLILANDEVGRAITDLLAVKAKAGVEVRVLVDSLFKLRTARRQVTTLRHAGARLAWFMPVWHVPFRGNANLRLHRKSIVVDDDVAIIGGMNLAREYMGPTPIPDRWRDLSARVRGPAVSDIARVFRADFAFASGEVLASAPRRREETDADAMIQVVGSGPDVAGDLLYDAFLTGVFEAKRRLWIATPYFVPDEALARAIVIAARRGVDVRIVVPARSNHITADWAGASFLRDIQAVGGKVCAFQPGMMHAKIFLVDDSLGVLGSANIDMRSLFLNFEIALLFSSPREIAALDEWFASALLPHCADMKRVGRARIVVEGIARLVAPLE